MGMRTSIIITNDATYPDVLFSSKQLQTTHTSISCSLCLSLIINNSCAGPNPRDMIKLGRAANYGMLGVTIMGFYLGSTYIPSLLFVV